MPVPPLPEQAAVTPPHRKGCATQLGDKICYARLTGESDGCHNSVTPPFEVVTEEKVVDIFCVGDIPPLELRNIDIIAYAEPWDDL